MTAPENGKVHRVPFDELIAYLDGLVVAFEEHPDEATRDAVFELLQGIDGMHREGFKRLAAFLEDHEAGHLLAEAAKADRLLKSVLNLYDVLPDEEALSQVETALARVRPYIESHGGKLKVLSVEGGVVHLEMAGSCNGCPSSTITLQRGIKQALRDDFPGFEEIVVHEPRLEVLGVNQEGLIISNQALPSSAILQAPLFKPVARLEEVPLGTMKQVTLDDVRALVANVDDEIYAVGEVCPGSALPLSAGTLSGATVICPWHNERYDVRSGKCLELAGRHDSPRLPVYPVAVVEDEIRIAINVVARPLLAEAQIESD